MSATLPKAPTGGGRRAVWLRRLIAAITGGQVREITGFTRRETAEGIFFDPPKAQASDDWRFGNKIEVDPTKNYGTEIVINIQPTHTLVTTGRVDRTTGALVKATAGMFVARQAVAAVGSDGKWNVPRIPIPVPSNYDDPNNFWLPAGGGGTTTCPYG